MYRDRYKTTWWCKFLCCELVNRAHKYLCPCTRLSMSYRLNNWLGNGLGDPIWLRWPKYKNRRSFIYSIRQQIGNVARNTELLKLCAAIWHFFSKILEDFRYLTVSTPKNKIRVQSKNVKFLNQCFARVRCWKSVLNSRNLQ